MGMLHLAMNIDRSVECVTLVLVWVRYRYQKTMTDDRNGLFIQMNNTQHLKIDRKELVRQTEERMQQLEAVCGYCQGKGKTYNVNLREIDCPLCRGKGKVYFRRNSPEPILYVSETVTVCQKPPKKNEL